MEEQLLSQETEQRFAELQQRLQDLLRQCDQLRAEKQTLQDQIADLHSEQHRLQEQHRQSRARIDAMVARFNGLGQSS